MLKTIAFLFCLCVSNVLAEKKHIFEDKEHLGIYYNKHVGDLMEQI